MRRHCVTLCRRDSMPEEREYLDLINAYNGAGGSAPESDDKTLGKGYTVFISSDDPPTADELQERFSNLSILEISEIPARHNAQPSSQCVQGDEPHEQLPASDETP